MRFPCADRIMEIAVTSLCDITGFISFRKHIIIIIIIIIIILFFFRHSSGCWAVKNWIIIIIHFNGIGLTD
jgi:hypothetical protein